MSYLEKTRELNHYHKLNDVVALYGDNGKFARFLTAYEYISMVNHDVD